MTMTYQGANSGTIIADEYIGGTSPQRGYGALLASPNKTNIYNLKVRALYGRRDDILFVLPLPSDRGQFFCRQS